MELGIRAATAAIPGKPRTRGADHTLATRLAWITGLRLGFLILLLGATATLYLGGELARYPVSLRIVFLTIVAGFGQAVFYGAVLRTGRRLATLAWTQIVLDQLTWTAIVYVSGGASSGATSFYALTCLIGAILVGQRGAGVAAAVGVAIYATLCAGFHYRWILPPADQGSTTYATSIHDLTYPLLLNTLGVTVVALLAGYLAERLRLTGGALQAATTRAQEAERLAVLGRIAAGLAHEIRNPLGSITGSIEMLRESPALSDEDRQLCDIVHREARRLNDLVGDMVDLSKPRPPHAQATDVAGLAREVVALATNASRGSDIDVRYQGPEGRAIARCDGGQIRQVLWNLVRNALQASPAGSTVRVSVTPGAPGQAEQTGQDEVVLAVDDEGPGVPDDVGSRMFQDFFTTRTHGAGIGLAVVRRIMEDHEAMGARLEVERSVHGGACFRVTLSADVTGLRKSARPPPS